MRYHRPRLQRLEDRLAPANLAIVSAVLMDNNIPPAPQPTPVIGQRLFVQANWTTSGLSTSDSYNVRIAVDGIAMETDFLFGVVGNNLSFSTTLDGWYATSGSHSVTVTLDPFNLVAETNESDNATTIGFTTGPVAGLTERLISPIHGTQNQTWGIGNYADVDPRWWQQSDYRGGPFTYDGHDGIDAGPVLFSAMDRGTPIYAAAGGTVSLIGDTDAFDRWTINDFTLSRPVNWVVVDHGNGWSTFYDHLAMNSITVEVGDTVRAGDVVGLMGSSGNSANVHLHFALRYRGSVVETGFDLANYWQNAPTYPTDVPATILDSGITNLNLFDDMSRERLPDINTFSTTTNDDIYFWYFPNRTKANEPIQVTYYRPDGSSFSNGYTPPTSAPTGAFNNWSIDRSIWGPHPGVWQVAASFGGVELLRKSFTVTNGAGVPSIRLGDLFDDLVADGRTTPVDFGSAPLNGAPRTMNFIVSNHGSAPLILTSVQLPVGFALQGAFPGSVAANATATFTVAMTTTTAGPQFGEVRFGSNDPDTPLFNFNVGGMVTGAPPTGTPAIETPLPATAFYHGRGDQLVTPTATVTDSNSPNFDGGQLRMEIASGGDANDFLGIRSQGFGPGEIGIGDVTIWYSGVPTAMYASGTTQSTTILNLIEGATTEAVQALIRNLTYNNNAATPQTHRRYVRITLTDDTGLVSNRAIVDVIHAGRLSPAPHVANVRVNDGSAQRSRITSLTVTFDAAVTFAGAVGNAFTLTRTGGGAVSLAATANIVNGVTVVTLNNFTGAAQFGSLRDGRYTLTTLASEITLNGVQLNNGVNGTFGDSQGLYRFFGDTNGDRRIDISDFGGFSATFNRQAADPLFNPIFDFNNDGRIDIADFGQFSVRYFTTLP